MSNTGIFRDVVAKLMEGTTIDKNNKLQIIDESVMAEADELLDNLLKETARDWWMQMEAQEDSLASMQDSIDFDEMNTDPSHVTLPPLALDKDDASTMESMLGESEFNLESIFSEDNDDDLTPIDGDDQHDEMLMGGSGPMDDDGEDYPDDMDAMGDDEDFDDPMGDEFGDTDPEFSFDFLNDDDPMDDDGEDYPDDMDAMGDDEDFDDPMEGFMEADDDCSDDHCDDPKCDDEDDE